MYVYLFNLDISTLLYGSHHPISLKVQRNFVTTNL